MNINLTKKDALITIACVVFLMANLGAIGSAARQQAKESVCLSNLNQWGYAFNMWLNDHDGTFMNNNDKWFYALAPYYGAPYRTEDIRREYMLRFCPLATRLEKEGAKQPFAAWQMIPQPSTNYPYLNYYWDGSYGSNSWMYYGSGSAYNNYWKTANVQSTNKIPLLLDSAFFGGRPTETDPPPQFSGDVVNAQMVGYFMKQFCIDRHNGVVNAIFMDFSARPVGLKELWTLRWHRAYKCRTPLWPEWMRGFKDYGCKIESMNPMAR